MDIFSERAKRILKAIVEDYISTAEPVSSKAVATKYSLGLSPATIRNIMAELENEGFLMQPHTSAGRVPTDKSFRLYVDGLHELDELSQNDKDLLKKRFDESRGLEDILTETAKALSLLTSCAGLMFIPRKEHFIIRHIHLVPMDRTGLMVLLVSTLGMVESRMVRLESELSTVDLERITNYLNSVAGGLTIRELRLKIVEEMQHEKNLYDELLARALSLGVKALQDTELSGESGIYVEGKVKIMEQPEFRDDFKRMKKIFEAFEEKSLLVKILDKSLEADGIHIYLGSESRVEGFEGLSFVTAPYRMDGEVLGTLGVIGPVRMNYSKIIPLVDYTAGLLSKVF